MAGGPYFPVSTYPASAPNTFESIHVGAGANSKHDRGLGVAASIASDSIWRLRIPIPEQEPTGTPTLRLLALANATSNAAKVNPKWAVVAAGEDPSSAALNAEGTSTLTWAAGDADDYKELTITLDADTTVAGDMIVMDLTFETTGWTLAVVSTWQVMLVYV